MTQTVSVDEAQDKLPDLLAQALAGPGMKLLLDTHIFIWWADQPERLSPAALSALEDEANELLLSVASVWEMRSRFNWVN